MVHNVNDPDQAGSQGHKNIVISMCWFANHLLRNLAEEKVYFRAVLLNGEFFCKDLGKITAFYGKGLITAYDIEKQMPGIGLHISEDCKNYCDEFNTEEWATIRHDDKCYYYVFLTSEIDIISRFVATAKNDIRAHLSTPEYNDKFLQEVKYLSNIHKGSITINDCKVQKKYENTYNRHKRQYPIILEALERHNFNWDNTFNNL